MKIIAFSVSEYPNGFSPMSYRLHYYMKALQSKGAEVEIVIASIEKKENGIYEGIPYSFVHVINQRSMFNERKVVKEFASIFFDLAKRSDVVFTSEDTNYSIRKLTKSVHAAGGKIVIELNENPYSIKASRKDSKLFLKLNRLFFLNYTLPKVNGVITISHALSDLVEKYKGKNVSMVRVPILSGESEIIKHKNYKGIPYILHAGALSEQKDGVKAMLESFSIAHKRLGGNLRFIFTCKTGFPSLLAWIDNFIQKNGLKEDIEFKGLVPKEELNELYNNCSLAIVNKPSNIQNDYNFPTKLTELLPREIPVIISRTEELTHYFLDNVNAYMVEANDIEQIAEKIVYIITHPIEAATVAHNGRCLAGDEFYYQNHSDKLYDFFEKIVKQKQ
jgi:glycosyltransferase involved in cell wall biosynthesis